MNPILLLASILWLLGLASLGHAAMPVHAAVACAPQVDIAAQLREAQQAYEAGDHARTETVARALTGSAPTRWEGHMLLGAALAKQGKPGAPEAFAEAKKMAPAEKHAAIDELARLASATRPASSSGAAASAEDKMKVAITRNLVKKLDAEADPAKRTALQRDLLQRTEALPTAPDLRRLVLFVRARAALELDDVEVGWSTAKALRDLGAATSDDEAEMEVLAELELKGWNAATKPDVRQVQDSMHADEKDSVSNEDERLVATVRVIMSDMAKVKDPSRRSALAKELRGITSELPLRRKTRIEMLFARAWLALETDDDEMGWSVAQDIKNMNAWESRDAARLDLLVRMQRMGWDAEAKPDFAASKRSRLLAELKKVHTDFRSSLAAAVTIEWRDGLPGWEDEFIWTKVSPHVEFNGNAFAKIEQRATCRPVRRNLLPTDRLGNVEYIIIDARNFDENNEEFCGPWEPRDEVPPAGGVIMHLGCKPEKSAMKSVRSLFRLPRPESDRWQEDSTRQSEGWYHFVQYGLHGYAASYDSVAAVRGVLSRWKAIALQLDALDAAQSDRGGGAK